MLSSSRRASLRAKLVAPWILVALICALALPLHAQELEISVSPTPIGSGARAAGMADAFVAIADDATAASWNPAGLVQLEEPEISIVGAWNYVGDDFDAASFHPEVDGYHDVRNLELNYFSAVYPLPVAVFDRNITISLNYQRKYDFTRKFSMRFNRHTTFSLPFGGASVFSLPGRLDFEQEGGLATVSPAIAVELTHRLSIGATLNLWRSTPFSENSWTQVTENASTGILNNNYSIGASKMKETYRDFSGENLTLGVLWDIDNRWKLGMRYDTAFTGEADYERRGRNYQYPGFSPLVSGQRTREKRQIRFPDTLALGVSFRANDRLTLSLDVTRTDWNDFYVKSGRGLRRSLVDASNLDKRNESTDMDPTYTIRFGAEYIFVPRYPSETLKRLWTLRGGVFYDEEPATGLRGTAGTRRGDGDADPFYGVALGVGLQLHQRVNIDAAYQYRFGKGVNADFIRGVPDFEEDVDQHRILVSTVIYF